jgi:hypothetical protein
LNDQFVLLDGGAGTQDRGATNVSAGVPLQVLNFELDGDDTVVTIKATDNAAAEANSDPGLFTITRVGSIITPLTVSYVVTGTATGGAPGTADYDALTGTIDFAIGAETVTIAIVPRDDLDIEAQETVVLTLSPGVDYFVGTPNKATVKITDDDPTTQRTLTATGSVWKYLDDGSDQGTAWQAPGFDDSAWVSGAGQLGFGDGDEATILNAGQMTYYFRRTFTIPSAAVFTQLTLSMIRDDGAVVYLNGVELVRDNMPSGAINYLTRASDSAPSDEENDVHSFTLAPGLLVDGVNTLAVEVHQSSSGSGDVSFDLSLIGTIPFSTINITATDAAASEPSVDTGTFTITRDGDISYALPVTIVLSGTATNGTDYTTLSTTTVVIPAGASSVNVTVAPRDDLDNEGSETVTLSLASGLGYNLGANTSATVTITDDLIDSLTNRMITPGSVWKYLDDGSNQGTAWRDPLFDDAAWDTGAAMLGFGEDEQTTVSSGFLTYYFRRSFDVTDPSQYDTLKVRLLRDDGGVVYLNGAEVFRSNMPAGTITSTTRAVEGVSGADENTFFEVDISPALLVAGNNVLAVEVHQVTSGSPDLAFDLELIARQPVPLATVTITADDDAASEIGPDGGTFTITRSGGDVSIPLTVNYTVGGTASSSDYSALAGSVTLAVGVTSATFTVTPVDDAEMEDGESIGLTLSSSSGYTLGAASTATVNIVDNDGLVSVTASDATASEPGADTAELTFTRTGGTGWPLTVNYTVSGSAAGSDHTGLTGSVTIPAGSASATVTITALDDTESEDTETLTVTVSPSSAYVIGTPSSADVSILDDGDIPLVDLTADDTAATEGADTGTFTFTRNGPTANPLTVNYTLGGTAASGDYDAAIQTGSVIIPAGSASVTVSLTPTDDLDPEDPETAILNLAAGAGYILGTSTATVTVLDNDLPTVNVAATDASASELGLDTGSFTFTRNGPTTNPLTIPYTLGGTASGSDYTGPTGTVIIPAGESSVTVTVTPVSDSAVEVAESVTVTLTTGATYMAGPSSSASVGIEEYRKLIPVGATWKYLDNGSNQGTAWRETAFDDSVWSSGAAQLGFGEGDEATVVASGKVTYYFRHAFPVADAAQFTNLKVRLQRDDGAVVYLNGTEVFRSNMPSGTISSTTLASTGTSGSAENVFFEANIGSGLLVNGTNVLAVEVHQSSSSGNTDLSFNLELLGTLLPATVSVSATDADAAEPAQDPGTFTITRSGDTAGPLVVTYTLGGSAAGSDYTGPTGTVTIPAGSSSATVTVTPVDDIDPEESETVVLNPSTDATYTVGTPASAAIAIADDDVPTVSMTASDASAAEFGADPATITLTRTGPTVQSLTVNYTLAGSSGSGDYDALTGTVTFAAGSATATIAITPIDDSEIEVTENLELALEASSNYIVGTPSSASVTILDNDTVVTIAPTDADAAEAGTDPGEFTLTRTGDLTEALTVTYTIGGTATGGSAGSGDYEALSGTATFAAGSSTVTVTVTPNDDLEPEAAETVVVSLAGGALYTVGAPDSATVNIGDNETTITIAATDDSAAESASDEGTFTLTRSGDLSAELTVGYTVSGTAVGGAAGTGDYEALSGSVTSPPVLIRRPSRSRPMTTRMPSRVRRSS